MSERKVSGHSDPQAAREKGEAIGQAVDEVDRRTGFRLGTIILMIASGLYALVGAIDLLPDFIPVVGELDDGVAFFLFFRSLSRLTGSRLGFGR